MEMAAEMSAARNAPGARQTAWVSANTRLPLLCFALLGNRVEQAGVYCALVGTAVVYMSAISRLDYKPFVREGTNRAVGWTCTCCCTLSIGYHSLQKTTTYVYVNCTSSVRQGLMFTVARAGCRPRKGCVPTHIGALPITHTSQLPHKDAVSSPFHHRAHSGVCTQHEEASCTPRAVRNVSIQQLCRNAGGYHQPINFYPSSRNRPLKEFPPRRRERPVQQNGRASRKEIQDRVDAQCPCFIATSVEHML